MQEVCDVFDVANQGALTIHTPLEALFSEYRKDRDSVERIASFVSQEAGAMTHFFQAAMVDKRTGSLSARSLFDKKPAIKAMDAHFWSRAIALTDVLDVMDAKSRNEWTEMIQKHVTPSFEEDSVRATLQSLLMRRQEFFVDRVDGLFRALSGDHVTNVPEGFRKRMIINHVLTNYGHGTIFLNHQRVEFIHDLRVILAMFMGRTGGKKFSTYSDVDGINRAALYGKWQVFDGGAFKIKLHMAGTAHLEIHPQMAYRLNQVLASKYPHAIPAQHRTKQPAKAAEFELRSDLIDQAVLHELAEGSLQKDGKTLVFWNALSTEVQRILLYLGGVQTSRGKWSFDYLLDGVIGEVVRFGALPEQKSHQYYPTPEVLAHLVVDMLDVGDDDECLEPQAGQGALADLLPKERTTCVEISPLHAAVLKAKGYRTVCEDFLQWQPGRTFNKIAMNPPFSDGRWLLHLRHAASMLAESGTLSAVLPASARGKTLIDGLAHEWSETFSDQFDGTGVNVAILKLESLPR